MSEKTEQSRIVQKELDDLISFVFGQAPVEERLAAMQTLFDKVSKDPTCLRGKEQRLLTGMPRIRNNEIRVLLANMLSIVPMKAADLSKLAFELLYYWLRAELSSAQLKISCMDALLSMSVGKPFLRHELFIELEALSVRATDERVRLHARRLISMSKQ